VQYRSTGSTTNTGLPCYHICALRARRHQDTCRACCHGGRIPNAVLNKISPLHPDELHAKVLVNVVGATTPLEDAYLKKKYELSRENLRTLTNFLSTSNRLHRNHGTLDTSILDQYPLISSIPIMYNPDPEVQALFQHQVGESGGYAPPAQNNVGPAEQMEPAPVIRTSGSGKGMYLEAQVV
jgi:hypothetical protein